MNKILFTNFFKIVYSVGMMQLWKNDSLKEQLPYCANLFLKPVGGKSVKIKSIIKSASIGKCSGSRLFQYDFQRANRKLLLFCHCVLLFLISPTYMTLSGKNVFLKLLGDCLTSSGHSLNACWMMLWKYKRERNEDNVNKVCKAC